MKLNTSSTLAIFAAQNVPILLNIKMKRLTKIWDT